MLTEGPPDVRIPTWTVEDMPLLDDWPAGYRYEASDGVLEVSPPPELGHDDLGEQLQDQIAPQLPAGWRVGLARPVTTTHGWRIPDLLVRRHPSGQSSRARAFPAADVGLVVEIESPSGLRRDRVTKFEEYAEAGISAYWRVEQQPALVVVAYVLRGGGYEQQLRLSGGSAVLPGPVPLRVDVDALRQPS